MTTNIREVEEQNTKNISSLVTNTVLNTKISGIENKIPDHSKDITTQEFNKWATGNFAAR